MSTKTLALLKVGHKLLYRCLPRNNRAVTDNVVRVVRFRSKRRADMDVDRYRAAGWYVGHAYPLRWKGCWMVVAQKQAAGQIDKEVVWLR